MSKKKKKGDPRKKTRVFTKDEAKILYKILLLDPDALYTCINYDFIHTVVRDHMDVSRASFICSIESDTILDGDRNRNVWITAFVKGKGIYYIDIPASENDKFIVLDSLLRAFDYREIKYDKKSRNDKEDDKVENSKTECLNTMLETLYTKGRSAVLDGTNAFYYDLMNDMSSIEFATLIMDNDRRKRWNWYRDSVNAAKRIFINDVDLFNGLCRCIRANPVSMLMFVEGLEGLGIEHEFRDNGEIQKIRIKRKPGLLVNFKDDEYMCDVAVSYSNGITDELELTKAEFDVFRTLVKSMAVVILDIDEVKKEISESDDDDKDEFLDDENDNSDDNSDDKNTNDEWDDEIVRAYMKKKVEALNKPQSEGDEANSSKEEETPKEDDDDKDEFLDDEDKKESVDDWFSFDVLNTMTFDEREEIAKEDDEHKELIANYLKICEEFSTKIPEKQTSILCKLFLKSNYSSDYVLEFARGNVRSLNYTHESEDDIDIELSHFAYLGDIKKMDYFDEKCKAYPLCSLKTKNPSTSMEDSYKLNREQSRIVCNYLWYSYHVLHDLVNLRHNDDK